MGVDCALAGSSTVHTSLPVSASNACRCGSSAAGGKDQSAGRSHGPTEADRLPAARPRPCCPAEPPTAACRSSDRRPPAAPHGGRLHGMPRAIPASPDASRTACRTAARIRRPKPFLWLLAGGRHICARNQFGHRGHAVGVREQSCAPGPTPRCPSSRRRRCPETHRALESSAA